MTRVESLELYNTIIAHTAIYFDVRSTLIIHSPICVRSAYHQVIPSVILLTVVGHRSLSADRAVRVKVVRGMNLAYSSKVVHKVCSHRLFLAFIDQDTFYLYSFATGESRGHTSGRTRHQGYTGFLYSRPKFTRFQGFCSLHEYLHTWRKRHLACVRVKTEGTSCRDNDRTNSGGVCMCVK